MLGDVSTGFGAHHSYNKALNSDLRLDVDVFVNGFEVENLGEQFKVQKGTQLSEGLRGQKIRIMTTWLLLSNISFLLEWIGNQR